MMEVSPPVYDMKSLQKTEQRRYERFQGLISHFKEKFGKDPEFIARAPGRVNLIGEHIDYCGYSVLPMAIEQDICTAVARNNDSEICICNLDSETYRGFSAPSKNYSIDKVSPQWFHYFLCGYRGLCEFGNLSHASGMDVLVHGIVPKNAGLSSSSALVCVAGLATATANETSISKLAIADVMAKCERYIGTQGGGMDQSISFLAEEGSAKLISFNPLRTEEVNLPEGAVFVISNCCVELNKAATSHFNQRVAECKIATQILAKRNGIDCSSVRRFHEVQEKLSATFDEMLKLIESQLDKDSYSREEILDILQISDQQLIDTCLSENTKNVQSFLLRQRAKHVFSEAQRVLEFRDICRSESEKKLQRLGELMNASHKSCSEMYECSCPELDTLTQLCRDYGALGSRLTGAGWGGCAVSLVPSEKLDGFLKAVKEGYYDKIGSRLGGRTIEEVLFATKPGSGAAVYKIN